MTYTKDSPILGKGALLTHEAMSWVRDRRDNKQSWPESVNGQPFWEFIGDYVLELERLCYLIGFDFGLLFSQFCHESDDASSPIFLARGNGIGLGVTDGGDDGIAFQNGTDAARAHIAHMRVYVYGDQVLREPANSEAGPDDDPRWNNVILASWDGTVRTLNDLTGKWATDPTYGEEIAAKANAVLAATKGNSVADSPRIILNPGHRNSTGGNHEEAEWTPALADAYFDAFSAAGYETINLGDTNGGLDETSRRMAAAIQSAPGDCVLLDLHYEGSPVPGVFVIIPDVTGLTTGAPVAQPPLDTWNNNAKDREVGKAIALKIAQKTGLNLRTSGVREPGLMDESQTGVGGQGYRLATMAYTAPYHFRAVRLVVEHGNHTINPDRAIMLRMGPTTGFPKACAAAAVEAVNAIYGKPDTEPQPAPIWWDKDDVGGQKRPGDGAVAYAFYGEVTALRKVPLYASVGGVKVAEMKLGEKAIIRGTYLQPNGDKKPIPWAFISWDPTHPEKVGRARLSAFFPKWPTV